MDSAKDRLDDRFESLIPTDVVRATQVIIATLLVTGTLYLCSSLFIPIVIALLAYLTLRPVVCQLCARGLHQVIASGLVIAGMFLSVGIVAVLLFAPAQHWIAEAPKSAEKIGSNLAALKQPLTVVDQVEGKLEDVSGQVDDEPQLEVSVKKPSMVDESVLINTTGRVLASIVAIAVLTFFMLSSGDDLLNRMLYVMPDHEKRRKVLELIGDIQQAIGTYLCQITFINIGLGVVVTLVMWMLGMPTPVLWGTLATLFNFIPYVGALAATTLVFVAAAASFDSVPRAVLTALAFWSVTALEGQLITPAILGKTLRVGPVVVLVAIAFWGFLWGLPGVFIAVPLLIVQRNIFARFDATFPLAVILGAEPLVEPEEDPIQEDEPIAACA